MLNEFFWCNSISLDTEWKSELINSRHFDKEIGHQNPRYSDYSALFHSIKKLSVLVFVWSSSSIKSLNLSAMAVESVTVVAPEIRVGAFILSKGTWHKHTTDTRSFVMLFTSLHFWSSTGLVEQINNFQTLSLKDFRAPDLEPFLSIHDDYFYHTQTPRKPEVSMLMWTHLWPFKCLVPHVVLLRISDFLSVFVFFLKVGDVRVRFSFAGLSVETSGLGAAQTVSHGHGALKKF